MRFKGGVTWARNRVEITTEDKRSSRCHLTHHMTHMLQSHSHLNQTNIPPLKGNDIQLHTLSKQVMTLISQIGYEVAHCVNRIMTTNGRRGVCCWRYSTFRVPVEMGIGNAELPGGCIQIFKDTHLQRNESWSITAWDHSDKLKCRFVISWLISNHMSIYALEVFSSDVTKSFYLM